MDSANYMPTTELEQLLGRCGAKAGASPYMLTLEVTETAVKTRLRHDLSIVGYSFKNTNTVVLTLP